MKTTKFLTILFALILGAAIDATAQSSTTTTATPLGDNQWSFTMPAGNVRLNATFNHLDLTVGLGADVIISELDAIDNIGSITTPTGTGITLQKTDDGYYHLTTTAETDVQTYTLSVKDTDDNLLYTIDLTVTDYYSPSLPTDWQKSVRIGGATIPDGCKEYLKIGDGNETEISSGGETISGEGELSVVYTIKDANNNIIHSTTHAVKIDKTKPSAPYITYMFDGVEKTINNISTDPDSPTEVQIANRTEITFHADNTLPDGVTSNSDLEYIYIGTTRWQENGAVYTITNDENDEVWTLTTKDKAGNLSDPVYLKWSVETPYYVVFETQYGTESHQYLFADESIDVSKLPSTTGDDTHRFDGWYNKDNEGTIGDKVTDWSSIAINSNRTFIAKWSYLVSYNTNGHNVAFGSAVQMPENEFKAHGTTFFPTIGMDSDDGYVCSSWLVTSDGSEWLSTNELDEPLTLYAKWTQYKYTVNTNTLNVQFDVESGVTSHQFTVGEIVKLKPYTNYVITGITITHATDAPVITATKADDGSYSFEVPVLPQKIGGSIGEGEDIFVTATTKEIGDANLSVTVSDCEYGKTPTWKTWWGTSEYPSITYKYTKEDGTVVDDIRTADVGDYYFCVHYEDADYIADKKAAFKITPADITVSLTYKEDLVYDGTQQVLIESDYSPANLQFSTDGGETWSTELPMGTNVGDHFWYKAVAEDANHNDMDATESISDIIKPKQLTATFSGSFEAIAGVEYSWDDVKEKFALDGVVDGDNGKVDVVISGSFSSNTEGNTSVELSSYAVTLTGAKANNYLKPTITIPLSVKPKYVIPKDVILAHIPDEITKVYDAYDYVLGGDGNPFDGSKEYTYTADDGHRITYTLDIYYKNGGIVTTSSRIDINMPQDTDPYTFDSDLRTYDAVNNNYYITGISGTITPKPIDVTVTLSEGYVPSIVYGSNDITDEMSDKIESAELDNDDICKESDDEGNVNWSDDVALDAPNVLNKATFPAGAKLGACDVTLTFNLTGEQSDNYLATATVSGIVTMADTDIPSFTVGKNADVIINLNCLDDTKTYSFVSSSDDCSIKKEDGEYHLKTTNDVAPGSYTIAIKEGTVQVGTINVTVKDYTPTALDNTNWQSAITIPSTNAEAPGYNVAVSVNNNSPLTANNENNFVVDTEGADVSVAYTLTDNAGTNTYHSVTKTVKIDKTAPGNPTVTYGDKNTQITCGTESSHTAITLPTGTTLNISATDALSGVSSFWTSATDQISGTINNNTEQATSYSIAYTLPTADTYSWALKAKDAAGNESGGCYVDVTVKPYYTVTLPPHMEFVDVDDVDVNNPLTHSFPVGEKVYFKLTDANAYTIRPHLYDIDDGYEAGSDGKVYVYPVDNYESYYITVPERNVTLSAGVKKKVTITASLEDFEYGNPDNIKPVIKKDGEELDVDDEDDNIKYFTRIHESEYTTFTGLESLNSLLSSSAGTYDLMVKYESDGEYGEYAPKDESGNYLLYFTVTPLPVTVTISGIEKTYDGTTNITTDPSDISITVKDENGNEVEFDYPFEIILDQTNNKDNKINEESVYSAADADNQDVTLKFVNYLSFLGESYLFKNCTPLGQSYGDYYYKITATGKIKPKKLTASISDVIKKTYDGTSEHDITSQVTLNSAGIIDGDKVELQSATATFTDSKPGTYEQDVTVSYELSNDNYYIADATVTGSIVAKTHTVYVGPNAQYFFEIPSITDATFPTANDYSLIYNAAEQKYSLSVNNGVSGTFTAATTDGGVVVTINVNDYAAGLFDDQSHESFEINAPQVNDDGYYMLSSTATDEPIVTPYKSLYQTVIGDLTKTGDVIVELYEDAAKTNLISRTTGKVKIKSNQSAPSLTATAETYCNQNDGKISGVDTETMEIFDSETNEYVDFRDYTVSEDGKMTGLVPGTYKIRYKATDDYNASEPTSVTIEEGIKIVVKFVDEDGNEFLDAEGAYISEAVKPQQLCYGSKVTEPSGVSKEGFSLNSWKKEDLSKWNFAVDVVSADLTLTADWSKLKYIVTLPEGMEFVTTPEDDGKFYYGTPVYFKVSDGYVVENVTVGNQLLTADADDKYSITVPASDVTVSATVKIVAAAPAVNSFTILNETVKGANDGKISGIVPNTLEYRKKGDTDYTEIAGAELSPLAPGTYEIRTKAADNNHVPSAPVEITIVASNVTLSVTFLDSDDGSQISQITGKEFNALITAPTAPTKNGYTFDGWYTDQDCSAANVYTFAANGNRLAADLTLYAKWTPVEYSITYNGLENATNASTNPATYTIEDDITLAAAIPAANSGKVFGGWKKGDDDITKIEKGTIGNITLTAVWDEYKIEVKKSSITIYKSDKNNAVTKGQLAYRVEKNGVAMEENAPEVIINVPDGITCSNAVGPVNLNLQEGRTDNYTVRSVDATQGGTIILSLPETYNCTNATVSVTIETVTVTAKMEDGTDFAPEKYYEPGTKLIVTLPNEPEFKISSGFFDKEQVGKQYTCTPVSQDNSQQPYFICYVKSCSSESGKNNDDVTFAEYEVKYKTTPEAPALTGTNETICGMNGGSISGVDAETMELYDPETKSYSDFSGYTVSTDGVMSALAPGTYKIRYKATDQNLASPETEITINSGTQKLAVTFKSDDAVLNDLTQNICYGETFNLPTNIEKEGHTFQYWYTTDDDKQFEVPENGIANNLTLNAKWETNSYVVALPEHMEFTEETVQNSNGYNDNDQELLCYYDQEVAFKFSEGYSAYGYVTIGETTLSPDNDGIYSFTMPANYVEVDAKWSKEFSSEDISAIAEKILRTLNINTQKVYDGGNWVMTNDNNMLSNNSTGFTVTYSGINLKISKIEYNNKNVETNKTITATAAQTSYENNNNRYTLPSETITLTTEGKITAKEATVTFTNTDDLTSTYGETIDLPNTIKFTTSNVIGNDKLGATFTNAALTSTSTSPNVGDYTIATSWTNTNYSVTFSPATLKWTITKATNTHESEPAITDITNETIAGKKDGKITGVNNTMEYSTDGGETYTAVHENTTELSSLAPGVYLIRYKGDQNHEPSNYKTITIQGGKIMTSVVAQDLTLTCGESDISLNLRAKASVDGKEIEVPGTWSVYFIKNSESGITSEVVGSVTEQGEFSGSITESGTYKAQFNPSENDKYTTPEAVEFTVTINLIDISANYEASVTDSYTYTGSEIKPEINITPKVVSVSMPSFTSNDYIVSYTDNINAGTAKATLSGKGCFSGNLKAEFTITPFVITPDDPKLTITVTPSESTFDGLAKEPSVSVTYDGKPIPAAEYSVTYSDNTNAGTATVTITDNNGGNYTINGGKKFTIKPLSIAANDPNLKITLDPDYDYTYDGTAKEPSVTVAIGDKMLTEGTDYTVEYTNNTNAGEATVTINSVENGNYTFTGIVSTKFDIEPADIDQSAVTELPQKSDTQLEYNGKAQPLVQAGTTTIGKFVYSLDGSTWQDNVPTGTAPAVYYVYYKVVDDNYNDYVPTDNNPIEVSIKREVNLDVAINGWSYSSEPISPVIKKDGEEISIDAVTLKYTDTNNNEVAISNTTPAGDYTLTVTYPATDTELEVTKTVTFTIAPATLSIANLLDTQKPTANKSGDNGLVYNGTAQALVAAPAGALPDGYTIKYKLGDATSAEIPTSEEGFAANIPVGKDVNTYTVYYYYSGDANHVGFYGGAIEVKIIPAALTVTADNITVSYGDPKPDYTATIVGLLADDTKASALKGTLTFDDDDYNTTTAVGEYTLTPSGYTADNYDITFVAGKLTVEANALDESKLEVVFDNATAEYTYNGEEQTPTFTLKYNGTEIPTSEYNVEFSNSKNVGEEATVTIKNKNGGNYTIPDKTVNFKIVPKEVSITWSNTSFTYDGSEHKPTATANNLIEGDVCEITVTGAQTNVGKDYIATATGLTGAASANYKLPAEKFVSGTFTINPKVVDSPTIKLEYDKIPFDNTAKTPSVKVYDGNTLIASTEYTAQYEDNTNPGTAKVIITDNEGGNYTVSGSKTFTIQAVYTVTFHTAHGTAPAQKTGIVEGSTIAAPTDGNMTATGYTFLNGWYTDGVDFADDTKWDFANGIVDRNLDLYAKWNVDTYTITLTLNGGTLDPAIESNTITGVHFGESIVVPEKMMPTRNGYNFGGWTYNGSNLTADMKMPAANIELVAVWNIKTVTVHFVDVDGSKLYDDYTAEYNTPFPVIDKPEDKDGRTFVSWNPQLPYNMPAEETTYKAVRRELHERSITFDMGAAKGDVAAPASIIAEADVDISNELPNESFDWEGHEFIGWMSSDDNQMVDNLPAVMPDHDVVFTAQWKANTYYVTYMINDVEDGEKQPVEYGKKIALREIVKEGYTFSGWSYNGSSISNMTMPASDITLVGTLTINSYPITFYVDNQYYSSTENNVDYGTRIQQLLPEVKAPTGYSFSGWNYGNAAVPADMTMPNHAIDIKGTFVKNKYTITYVYDNGDDNKKVEVLFGDEIQPDDPARKGYNFIGWDKEVPFNMPADDVTITAQWQIKTFTITFKNYDGTTVLQTIENVEYGTVPAYTGETPEKAASAGIGHVFEGWVDDAGNQYGKDGVLPAAENNATYTAWFTDYDNVAPTIASVTVNGIEFVGTDVDVVECIESGKMTINATDDNSGVATIEYTIHRSNGEDDIKVYTEPVTLEPGYYVISIVATDNAGNSTAPMDVVAIVRREATLSTTEYTYTQLSGKDVVLEGLDLDGASVHSITIDGVEYTNIFKPETNALDHSLLDNVKIGSHALHLYTDFGGEKHDTGIEFTLTVKGFVITTEQKDDIINAEGFCQGDISVVTLAFLDRDCPKYYKIKGIHDKYVLFEDWGSLGKDLGKLMFDVTDDFQPGTIEFEVSFTDDPTTNTESEFETFKVKINASNDRILKLFNDLIAIDNHDDLFTAFQWYKDGMKIEGADQQYYQSDGNIAGNYSAYVTTTSGETVKVCYVNFEDDGLSKSLKRSVNAYPNPARAYEEITLELLNYDEAEYEGCVIKVVNAQGAIVATIDNCDRINTVSLPSGTYTGYVIRSGKNGDRVSFKLIVK